MKHRSISNPRSLKRKKLSRKAVTVNLPRDYPWKVLDKLRLDLQEYLELQDAKRLTEIVRNRDFEGYLALAEDWGLQSISSGDISPAEMRSKYLLSSLIKKFRFKTDQKLREEAATKIFLEAESLCKSFNQSGYKDLISDENDWTVRVFRNAKEFLVKLLGRELPGHRELLSKARHGPGSTLGTKKGNISLYHKYSEWPYSCTIDALRYAQFAIATDQRWIGALQDSYRDRFGLPKHSIISEKHFWKSVIKVVDGNRITFVPKDARKERTIAIEPTLNLYLQLGVDGFIRKRLKRWGVDLDSQVKNQELARRGSLPTFRDGFVTIDLSAASDSLSLRLCELLLPRDWYSYLMDLRCPSGTLEGKDLVYEKISSMGNGYTFALESAIFTAIVYAVIKADGDSFDKKKIAVFGDDIIVPNRYYFKVVEALRLSGFRTNLEKTFSSGPIRESCGADWFLGLPVRPVLLEDTPTDVMGLFCDFNRLKRLLSLRFGLEESRTLDMLEKWIPPKFKTYVGPFSDEEFDSYIHVASPPSGSYRHWIYEYKRIAIDPLPRKGRSFLFRKLMHDLRGQPIRLPHWDKVRKVTGGGSRFTVTSRNALKVSKAYSVASFWQSKYTDYGASKLEL